ncbi:hypothetical protein [Paucilactobacillus kaifaensis]|uniref:hypothetical protein n=1 Tax=Paucilactobacillus kaifaensis TaxID=2559921 RepID=UPI0010F995A8|nr:hypothetical protein [Paucilactobacillus kaifaensis]
MSAVIPENMEEIMIKQAMLAKNGKDVSTDELIKQAVLDAFQAFIDQELEGHYDQVSWDSKQLVVHDINHDEIARIDPQTDSFITDFEDNAQLVLFKLEDQARKLIGSR